MVSPIHPIPPSIHPSIHPPIHPPTCHVLLRCTSLHGHTLLTATTTQPQQQQLARRHLHDDFIVHLMYTDDYLICTCLSLLSDLLSSLLVAVVGGGVVGVVGSGIGCGDVLGAVCSTAVERGTGLDWTAVVDWSFLPRSSLACRYSLASLKSAASSSSPTVLMLASMPSLLTLSISPAYVIVLLMGNLLPPP